MSRYICEISPPGRRGPLTAGPQLLCTFGLMIGFFTCYGTANIDSSLAWRIPFIFLTGFSTVFVITSTLWLVPSPRWLVLRGRHDEVSAAWDVLEVDRKDREKVETEIQITVAGVQSSVDAADSSWQQDAISTHITDPTTKRGFFDVFARDVRVRTGLAVFLLAMQQLSGIDGVLYVGQPNFAWNNTLTMLSMRLFSFHKPVSYRRKLRSSPPEFLQSLYSL